jgi:hypothetical protein
MAGHELTTNPPISWLCSQGQFLCGEYKIASYDNVSLSYNKNLLSGNNFRESCFFLVQMSTYPAAYRKHYLSLINYSFVHGFSPPMGSIFFVQQYSSKLLNVAKFYHPKMNTSCLAELLVIHVFSSLVK